MPIEPKDVVASLVSLRAENGAGSLIGPARLASALGWDGSKVREREISHEDQSIQVGRGYLGIQPAALFATSVLGEQRPINAAALFGYHAAVRWGLLASDAGLTPFNSHWLAQNDWFVLPTIAWSKLENERELLEAFHPHNLADGAVDRLALQRYPTPALLQPVDDELVTRLDSWRDQALKSSRSESGVDDQLQTLFAKLFVLRTIEDRNLASEVTPLSESLIGNGRLDYNKLWNTFAAAKRYIGSELFDNTALDVIPEYVIGGIINDLYVPRKLPFGGRYNFSWIDADVLGLAYEKYLSTILYPLPPSPQMELFNNPVRGVERVSVRKANGVYYTPQYLTKYLSHKCVDDFYKTTEAGAIPKVIDFACGSGSFLVAALDHLLSKLKAADPSRNWGKALIEGGYIAGVDADEKAVTVARLNLWNRLAEESDPLPLPNLSKVIVRGDGLDADTWGNLQKNFDIVLGNPPFLATSRVAKADALEVRYEAAKGRYDYSSLFVEQAVKVSAPAGYIGMVIPNRLFRNQHAAAIRNIISRHMDLRTIVDFGSNEVFQGTSAYVGCVVAQHRQAQTAPPSSVKVVEVQSLPEQFVAAVLLDAEASGIAYSGIRVYEAQHPRGPGPWILLSNVEKLAQVQLSNISTPLSSICGIFQGIRTGANDIFILQIDSEDDQYGAQITNGLGDTAVLERGLLQPVVYGTEVRKYDSVRYNKYLLYPYINGVAVSEAELAHRYPQTSKYLEGYRSILSARTSISNSGVKWYELVRRRDEDWLKRQKLLIRDLAPETSFAVDEMGGVFIVGGTAVIPERDDLLLPLMVYLNSSNVNTLVRRSTPQFRGNFQKFEPQHLQRIPVLNRLIEDEAFSDTLAEIARHILGATNHVERSQYIEVADRAVRTAMSEAGLVAG